MGKRKLQQLLVEVGADVHEYSGRGMNGKTCLAVELDRSQPVLDLAADLIDIVGEDELSSVADELRGSRQDSMGISLVVLARGGVQPGRGGVG